MALSELPLSYCTNVHPGRNVAEVEAGLDRYTLPIQSRFGRPLAAGLWLANSVTNELLSSDAALARFAEGLQRRGLTCYTLNAFPFGDFHSAEVKRNVYLPDWTSPDRFTYTLNCARILARLLPDDIDGSMSTLPLGFKGFGHSEDFHDESARQLVKLATELSRIGKETGKHIRLAIEPEPLCILETTAEAIDFFRRLRHHAAAAGATAAVHDHIGLCFDVCHQSVEFEDVAESINSIDDAGIRINKVHISCAIELENPRTNHEGLAALRRYVEPRYLHQTTACINHEVLRLEDLSETFMRDPGPFADAPCWRVHFHVPVDAKRLGPLSTTRPDLIKALMAVAELDYDPHLEVETYTWEVLPGSGGSANLVEGFTRELISTQTLLSELE